VTNQNRSREDRPIADDQTHDASASVEPSTPPSLNDLIEEGLSRRDMVLGLAATGAVSVAAVVVSAAPVEAQTSGKATFNFKELAGGVDEKHHVAEGYDADVLIRWGDPLFPDSPPFDPMKQTAEAQKRQFGMNNDFLGFVALQREGNRGLLCVHHEYAESQMMFPGLGTNALAATMKTTAEQVGVEMASMGGSIVEIVRTKGKWSVNRASKYNRRITALETPMTVDGPAAGDARMKTSADPTGTRVIGTVNNCAGGITPWKTWLMTEENWHFYFGTGQIDERGRPKKGLGGAQEKSWARFDIPGMRSNWSKYVDRFNVDKESNEPNRFGWIVEVDPLDPKSTPVKHTALGRFRHEGAENAITRDGRVAIYSGDDDINDVRLQICFQGKNQSARPVSQHEAAFRGHTLCRPLRRRRHRTMAAAGAWPGAFDRSQRLCIAGRRAHRHQAGGERGWRNGNGPARRHRAWPRWPPDPRADQQYSPQD